MCSPLILARFYHLAFVQVWESCSEALITFDGQDQEDGTVAHIVENDVTLHSIKKNIPEHVEVCIHS